MPSNPTVRGMAAFALAAFASTVAAQSPTPARPAASSIAPAASPTPAAPRAATPKPAPSPAPTPSAAAKAEGKALFAKVVQAYGGKDRVSKVRDLQTRGVVTANTPQGEMTMEVQAAIVFPDRIAQQVDAPFGRVAMVATPEGAFVAGVSGAQDLPPSMRDELIRQVQRIPLFLAQKADDPALTAAAAGTEKIGDVDARLLDVRYHTVAVRWSVDPKSGRILRAVHTAQTPQGETQVVAEYSDFKVVDGFPVAFHMDVTSNGQKDQVMALDECKINKGVEAKLFEKPPPPPTPAPAEAAPGAPPASPTPK